MHRQNAADVVVSRVEPAVRFWMGGAAIGLLRASAGGIHQSQRLIMEPADTQGLPTDVLIVEDDAIIAMDFEDTILEFGVKSVRTASSVARALELIADRRPDFALLDVGLAIGNSFAVAERLHALQVPFVFVTGYRSAIGLPPALNGAPMLPKPCTREALEATLRLRSRR